MSMRFGVKLVAAVRVRHVVTQDLEGHAVSTEHYDDCMTDPEGVGYGR